MLTQDRQRFALVTGLDGLLGDPPIATIVVALIFLFRCRPLLCSR